MSNFAIISIHPSHVENILSGRKFFEYRKVLPKSDITHLVLYSTAPVMEIVAIVEVTGTLVGAPSKVWDATSLGAGITRNFFREYFAGYKTATAFQIGHVFRMTKPLPLKDLRKDMVAPQSFSYLDSQTVEKISLHQTTKGPTDSMIFMGGIHGVGKSTNCENIFRPAGYHCVTASSLLAQHEEMNDIGKIVNDVSRNQNIILGQLQARKESYPRVLMDGHFTLINKNGEIEPIELEVFRHINAHRLILIKDNPKFVTERLRRRDSSEWSVDFVSHFQRQEEDHARRISNELGIPLEVFTNSKSDISAMRNSLHWRNF